MDRRFSDICVLLLLIVFAPFAGCTSAQAQHGATATVSMTFVTPEKPFWQTYQGKNYRGKGEIVVKGA